MNASTSIHWSGLHTTKDHLIKLLLHDDKKNRKTMRAKVLQPRVMDDYEVISSRNKV
jgi:hypothetical protein